MKVIKNEYIALLDADVLHKKNVILGTDVLNRKTVLIRNKDISNERFSFTTDYFTLKTNVPIYIDDKGEIGNYHILICNSSDKSVNDHFERVSKYIFLNSDLSLSNDEVLSLFYSIEFLFQTTPDSDYKSLQIGVYGELIVIKYLFEMGLDHIANKWHNSFFMKHDIEINDKVRIEIKTTTKEKRIHRFKHNQVYRKDIIIYIISVMLEEVEQGYSLYQLCLDVLDLFKDIKSKLAVESLIKKCNISYENQGLTCNKENILNNIKLYDSKLLPKFEMKEPEGVSNTSYDIELSNVSDISIATLKHISTIS